MEYQLVSEFQPDQTPKNLL